MTLSLIVWAAGAGTAGAGVYTWTDASGIRHYSDRATQNSARKSDTLNPRHTVADKPVEPATPPPTHAPTILSPQTDERITRPRGEIVVLVDVPGGLRPDERLRYRLDGRELTDAPPRAVRLVIDALAPGRHELDVTLMDHATSTGRMDRVVFMVSASSDNASANAGRPPS